MPRKVNCAALGQYTLDIGGATYAYDCSFTARTGQGLTAAEACCARGKYAAVNKLTT